MGRVGSNDKRQVGDGAQGLRIHGHAAKGGFECIDRRSGNPAHGGIVRWPDQYDARNRLRATAKCRKCRGSNRARMNITRVRRDQRFGNTIDRRRDPGEEVRDLPLQTMRVVGVEFGRLPRMAGLPCFSNPITSYCVVARSPISAGSLN